MIYVNGKEFDGLDVGDLVELFDECGVEWTSDSMTSFTATKDGVLIDMDDDSWT